jgi:AcrR family transcriptional regulator
MIRSTALLVRERGARATSLDAVLEHSGAPRGSLYHHFPGGREQLLGEATDFAGEYVAGRLEREAGGGPLDALDALFEEYRANLISSDFRAGCPIVAVAVESSAEGPDLREHVVRAFDRWRQILIAQLTAAGLDTERSEQLAMLVISGFEGALILSRAYREVGPLQRIHAELREGVEAELTEANDRKVDR